MAYLGFIIVRMGYAHEKIVQGVGSSRSIRVHASLTQIAAALKPAR